jgi:hypothetical protein
VLDPAHVPPVAEDEQLARFILFSRWFRSSDHTVRPEAFMPHPHVDLSVTRHIQATEGELWAEGARIAGLRALTLYGRADVRASVMTAQRLTVVAAPLPENPNHANATGYPAGKPEQKMKALLIASQAKFVVRPA